MRAMSFPRSYQITMKLTTVILLGLIVCVTACKQEFENVSSSDLHVDLIGSTYQSIADLKLRGITTSTDKVKPLNYYLVFKPPGIGGPEVVSKHTIPVGTLVEILSVARCTNCRFDERVRIRVHLGLNNIEPDVDVFLVDLLSYDEGSAILDEQYFELLAR